MVSRTVSPFPYAAKWCPVPFSEGGIVVAIARELKLPVRFIGVGEALDDLQPFDAVAYVDALLP